MRRRIRDALTGQDGSVLLFTTVLLAVLLIFGGMAIDIAFQAAARTEVQRSLDAAALAGAGKLNFDASAFGTARANAQSYATSNPMRSGTVTLALNSGNAPDGNIVLGNWDANSRTFSPSLDPFQVNAVKTQFSTSVPTSFLRLLGIDSLAVGGQAIAWAPPPATPPLTNTATCVFPVGVIEAPCGSPVQMISSSSSSDVGVNTAGWVNLTACNAPANPQDTADAITAAANGSCPPSNLRTGMYLGTNNGELTPAFQAFSDVFPPQFNASQTVTIKDASDTIVYSGQAWAVNVPVLKPTSTSECPYPPPSPTALAPTFLGHLACAVRAQLAWLSPGPAFAASTVVNKNHEISGWSKFYIVQGVFKKECLVSNPNYTGVNCAALPTNAVPTMYGYLNCEKSEAEGQTPPVSGPFVSVANKLKLVQ